MEKMAFQKLNYTTITNSPTHCAQKSMRILKYLAESCRNGLQRDSNRFTEFLNTVVSVCNVV